MGLGRWPTVTIAEAREQAETARRLWRHGADPIAERKKQPKRDSQPTVAEMIFSCFEARKADLKDGGKAGGWLGPLTVHVIPKIGDVPVEQIDQHRLVTVFEPIWNTKPVVAKKALSRMNLTLKHAAAHGLTVDMQAAALAREILGKQEHVEKHFESLPYQEVPAFYAWLCTVPDISALALRLLILTAKRPGEVRLATFDEFDGNIWTLLPERTKSDREHKIPLSDEAMRVVEAARNIAVNDNLFSSYRGKPLSDAAMGKFMRTHGYDVHPHGFRSSFRTWCEDRTDADFAVMEASLGHAVDSGVVGAYQRSDRLEKRQNLMEGWSSFLVS